MIVLKWKKICFYTQLDALYELEKSEAVFDVKRFRRIKQKIDLERPSSCWHGDIRNQHGQ